METASYSVWDASGLSATIYSIALYKQEIPFVLFCDRTLTVLTSDSPADREADLMSFLNIVHKLPLMINKARSWFFSACVWLGLPEDRKSGHRKSYFLSDEFPTWCSGKALPA